MKFLSIKSGAVFLGVLLAGTAAFFFFFRQSEEFIVQKQDIVQQIFFSGSAVPAENIDLGFSVDGTIAAIPVRVGDRVESDAVLAELARGRKDAEIRQYEAKIAVEKAALSQLLSGVNGQELDLLEVKVTAASTALDNARRESEDVMLRTNNDLARRYVLAREYGETILLNTENAVKALEGVYDERNAFRAIFIIPESRERSDAQWQMSLSRTAFENIKTEYTKMKSSGSYAVIDAALANSKTNLEVIRTTLTKTAEILGGASVAFGAPDIGGFVTTMMVQRAVINTTQTGILTHEQDIEAQRIENQVAVNEANKKINEASAALTLAEGELAVKRAVSADAAIAMHQALIKEYESSLAVLKEDIANGMLRAPIAGVVVSIDARRGAPVKKHASVITLTPIGDTQVNGEMAPGDIAKIRIGDTAHIFFEGVEKEGKVVSISENEVRVHLNDAGGNAVLQQVSGSIDAVVKRGALLVPASFIFDENGGKAVRVKGPDGVHIVTVVSGIEWNGYVEVEEGVSEGDSVVRSGFFR